MQYDEGMPKTTAPAAPEPRPFDPKGRPRTWLLGSEQPPLWPEELVKGGLRYRCHAGVLYRFYDADRQLLYIGIADGDPTYRWTKHRHGSEWWYLAAYVSVTHVSPINSRRRAAEREAIRAEQPLYNKAHLHRRVRLDVRLDQGAESVIEQFRNAMLPDDFAVLVTAFKDEPDSSSSPISTY